MYECLSSQHRQTCSMIVKEHQIQILGQYSGRYVFQKLDTSDDRPVSMF